MSEREEDKRTPGRRRRSLAPPRAARESTDPLEFPISAERHEEPVGGDVATEAELGIGDWEDDDDFDAPSGDFTWAGEEEEPAQAFLAADLPADDREDHDPASLPVESNQSDPVEALHEGVDRGPAVRNVVGVKFAMAGKIYLYEGEDGRYERGEEVVVESDRGPRLGVVAIGSMRRAQSRASLRKILRRPESNDRRSMEKNLEREQEVLRKARAKARELGLPIKIFRAEYNLAGSRVTIYLSSDGKVEHRPLAQWLANEVKGRIDLRQTGVRDEAKMVGGIGSCGQTLCCSTWLPAFVPVSIRNAKDQGLVLNPAKVSGQCGRLKCCLVYEQALYAELRQGMPKLGKRVLTPDGEGRVVEVDVLHQRVRVSLVIGEFRIYQAQEVEPMFATRPDSAPPQS